MSLTKQLNTYVDVKKNKINVQKNGSTIALKYLTENNVIISFIIFSITFSKGTISI